MKSITRTKGIWVAGLASLSLVLTGCTPSVTKSVAETTSAPAAPAAVSVGIAYNEALYEQLPQDIKDKGYIVLATDPTDPPLAFYDKGGVLVGSEVDMVEALATILGVEILLTVSPFGNIIPGVEAGRFDGAVSGFADRPFRQQVVDFVNYFTTSRGLLVLKGQHPELKEATAELCGKAVAVALATSAAENVARQSAACIKSGKAKIDIQEYPTQADGVTAVRSGRADLTFFGAHAASWIAKQTEGEADELEVFLRPEDGKDINGILLRKGDLALVFQAAIQQLMDSGDFKTIWTKWGLQNVILSTAKINAGTVGK